MLFQLLKMHEKKIKLKIEILYKISANVFKSSSLQALYKTCNWFTLSIESKICTEKIFIYKSVEIIDNALNILHPTDKLSIFWLQCFKFHHMLSVKLKIWCQTA